MLTGERWPAMERGGWSAVMLFYYIYARKWAAVERGKFFFPKLVVKAARERINLGKKNNGGREGEMEGRRRNGGQLWIWLPYATILTCQ